MYEHAIDRVDVCAHAPAVSGRSWLHERADIREAIDLCDELADGDLAEGESGFDWSQHTVEVSRPRSSLEPDLVAGPSTPADTISAVEVPSALVPEPSPSGDGDRTGC